MFNCSFTLVETVYDVVDCLWLLLQGCGVGFKPITGTLNGFYKPIDDIRAIHTQRIGKGGREDHVEVQGRRGKSRLVTRRSLSLQERFAPHQ